MKLTIAGASVYGLGNVSDDSMLQSFIGGMRERVPDFDATLVCRHPGNDTEKLFGVRTIQNLDFPTKAESQGKRWRGFNPGDSADHLRAIRAELESSDALMIGGDPFDDSNTNMVEEPFRGILPYVVNVVTLAKYLQKKVVLFGIHLGRPPTSAYGTALTKFCLDNADLITTREDDTKERLIQAYGAAGAKIVSSADSGFALLHYVQSAEALPGVEPKEYIALTLRSYYWLWSDAQTREYAAKFAQFADRLAEHYQCKVLLVPHCAYELDSYWESDLNFQKEIFERCNNKERILAIGAYLGSSELLAALKHAKFVISNRRHSGIYAALLKVPFYLFGERNHVGKVYGSLGLAPRDYVDEQSLEKLFSGEFLERLDEALAGWDVEKTRASALVQERKCGYATDAVKALLTT